MLAVLALAIVGSTAWLAVDASKRDWTGNSFAKNVPSWVVGSLVLWILVFPMYVFVHRKKAPLLEDAKAKAAPQPVAPEPAAAMEIAQPAEQYGPSLEETELEAPAPAAEIQPEPVVEPVVEPEPEPVVEIQPEPVMDFTEPVIDLTPEPEPVVEIQPEPVLETEPEPVVAIQFDPVIDFVPEPAPVVEPEPEPEPESAAPEPILEISHPDMPAEQAPPGLSVDAFRDIKPVSFGGATPDEYAPAPADEPAPEVAFEPEPVTEPNPEPVIAMDPEPVIAPDPEPVIAPDPEPTFEPAPEPLSYPQLDPEPMLQLDPEPMPELEPEPAIAAAVVAEPVTEEAKPRRRGLRLPNPELKLPSFGKRKPKAVATSDAPKSTAKRGPKLPQITLPPNLQGPLNDVERKIALGSVVAILAAAAFGYSSAPADDAVSASPAPAPAAASR
jgi:hypothetical protein